MIRIAPLLVLLAVVPAGAAVRPTFAPAPGAHVDLSLTLQDSLGRPRGLGSVLGGKPAVLLLGYNKCPDLCGLTQAIVADTLQKSGLRAGDYRAIFLSIDPDETAADAAGGKAKLARIAGKPDMPDWTFLTGNAETIDRLTTALGFGYERRQRIEQFVHPVAVAVLTPTGRLSRLLPSTTLEPRDLRLALVEASGEQVGSLADRIVLFCAGFDSTKGQYTALVGRVLWMSGLSTLLLLGSAILLLSRGRRA